MVLPFECIVRWYLYGSIIEEYVKFWTIWGNMVNKGFSKWDKFDNPIFTVSTKVIQGDDENIFIDEMERLLEKFLLQNWFNKSKNDIKEMIYLMRNYSLCIYKMWYEYCASCSIVLADTKFEFWIDENCVIYVVDEILTPDSSRYRYVWDPLQRLWRSYVLNFALKERNKILDNKETGDGYNLSNKIPLEIPEDVILKTKDSYSTVVALLKINA